MGQAKHLNQNMFPDLCDFTRLQEKALRMVGRQGRVISDNAAEQAIRRLCKGGTKKKCTLNKDVVEQFFQGGSGRKELIKLWIELGGNQAS